MLLGLIRKELLTLSRDPHGLAALFLMPVAFIVVMSLALKDTFSPSTERMAYTLIDRDEGHLSKRFSEMLATRLGVPVPAPEDLDSTLRLGRIRYAILIERGFSEAVAAPHLASGGRVRLLAEPAIDQSLFRSTEAELAATVGELRANVLRENVLGVPDSNDGTQPQMVSAERIKTGARPTSVQQNVPAWLVFGMFFVVTAISSLFVQEQRDGTLTRLRSLGVPDYLQLAGKALPYLAINSIQAAMMFAVGVWLMPLLGVDGLQLSGVSWFALVSVVFAVSCSAISFALVLASLCHTEAQASTLGPMCNILMAAVGGIMVPTFVMPAFMRDFAVWSPMNWGLEGLLTVLLRHGGAIDALPQLIRLTVFTVAMVALGGALFVRRLR